MSIENEAPDRNSLMVSGDVRALHVMWCAVEENEIDISSLTPAHQSPDDEDPGVEDRAWIRPRCT
jgi:hypothetical protein